MVREGQAGGLLTWLEVMVGEEELAVGEAGFMLDFELGEEVGDAGRLELRHGDCKAYSECP